MERSPTQLPEERLSRESVFSYTCHCCSRCCYDKRIRVNPYEVARLAGAVGCKTSEFIDQFTTHGGTELKRNEDHSCVFLNAKGCGVHEDRPLVCRLYPLGRHLKADGEERFFHLTPHPQTAGVYGKDGTVNDYLRAQKVDAFIKAVDRYVDFASKLAGIVLYSEEKSALKENLKETISEEFKPSSPLLDFDSVVEQYCREHDIGVPSDVDERLDLHLQALEEWIQKSGATR